MTSILDLTLVTAPSNTRMRFAPLLKGLCLGLALAMAMGGTLMASGDDHGGGDRRDPPSAGYDVPFRFCITAPTSGISIGVGQAITFSHSFGQTSTWSFNDGTYSTSASSSHAFSLPGTYTVTLSCPDYSVSRHSDITKYQGGTCSIVVYVIAPPKIVSFTTTSTQVYAGQAVNLLYTVQGATGITISPGVGAVSGESPTVHPTSTTTYTLAATSPYGTSTATQIVTVKPAPTISTFTASPATINQGEVATLNWATTGEGVATSLDQGIGIVEGTSCTVLPSATTTYKLTATNPSGEVSSSSATVTVNRAPVFGAISLQPIRLGEPVILELPSATDPENGTIASYSVMSLPAGLSFDPATRRLTGTLSSPGTFRFLYCARDAGGALGTTWARLTAQAAGTQPGATTRIAYGYDDQGRLSTLTYPSGRIVAYTYDTLDRPRTITQNGQALVQEIDYDPWGNRSQIVDHSGAVDQWTYDATGSRVTQWVLGTPGASGTLQTRAYGYDAADRLTQAGEWSTLQYEPNGRLIQATGFGMTDTLTHDAYNNNTSSVVTSATVSLNNFTFNPLVDNHLPGETANGGFTQVNEDNFGEITNLGTGVSSPGALVMTWDDLGRMVSTSAGAAVEAYQYAASGYRTTRSDSSDPTLNRLYAYTGSGLLLSEYSYNPSPVWTRDVIYLGDLAIAEIDATSTHELHGDHQGTPRIVTSASGTIEGSVAYGPYGELIQQDGYIPLTGYTGHLQTEPGGLIYMRGRFYSPAWHRFLNSNQGIDPSLLNQFGYTLGSPLWMTDPSGLDNCPNTDGRSPESRAKGGVGRGGDYSGAHGGDPGHSSLADGEKAGREAAGILAGYSDGARTLSTLPAPVTPPANVVTSPAPTTAPTQPTPLDAPETYNFGPFTLSYKPGPLPSSTISLGSNYVSSNLLGTTIGLDSLTATKVSAVVGFGGSALGLACPAGAPIGVIGGAIGLVNTLSKDGVTIHVSNLGPHGVALPR